MPSAVPFQQGLIGQYNNSHGNPGVYVSWDPDTNFPSTQSLIFKGVANNDYRFPLIVSAYTNNSTQNLGLPIALGSGTTYIYCLNQSGLIAYKKVGNTFTTQAFASNSYLGSATPVNLKVGTIGTSEVIMVGFASNLTVFTFANSTFTKQNTIEYSVFVGASTSLYQDLDFSFYKDRLYCGFSGSVFATNVSMSGNTVVADAGSSGVIINSSNGLNAAVKKISNYDGSKVAVADYDNNISEWIYDGNINLGNTTSQWSLNFALTPSDQVWSALIYNHFGILVACDSYNNTVNVVASTSVTVNTTTYGFNGVGYSVESVSSSTSTEGQIINTVGSTGVNYQQFDTPNSVVEDQDYNIIVGDANNRLTYIPTALDFVASVAAPLNEFIDNSGNPADTYYIKQTNYDFTSTLSIQPMIGDELLLKSSVLFELNALLRVPVYDEEPLFGFQRTSATLAYGDMVTDPAPQVRITCSTNGGQRSSMFVLSPYTGFYNSLDQSLSDPFDNPSTLTNNYPNGLFYRFTNEGKFYFFDINGDPVSIQEYDTLLVTYYVRMFTNTQINNALYLALQAINAQPGLNKIYNVATVPFYYDATLVSGATYYLLRQLVVGLNQRERRLLVMDPESGSFDAVASIKDTAKMYQEEFNELLKKLPIAVRPVMGTVTVPEYAFPGGRSRMFRQIWKGGAS